MNGQATMFDAWDRASPEWVYSCPPGRNSEYRWRAHRIQRVTDKCLYVTRRSITIEQRDAGVIPPDEEKPYRLNRRWWERDGWHRHTDCRRSCLYARVGMERKPSPDEIAEEKRQRFEAEQRERAAWEAAHPDEAAAQRRRSEERWQQTLRDMQERMRRTFEESARGEYSFSFPAVPRHDTAIDAHTLGITWPCSREALKAAYRRLAKETHPDAGGSAEEFRRVNEAYERLQGAVAS